MNYSIIRRAQARHLQAGIVLLEALIAIVLFGVGVIGLLGLQANSIKESTNAKFRSDASLLADQLVGKMWVSNHDYAALQAAYASPSGTEYVKWVGTAGAPGPAMANLPHKAAGTGASPSAGTPKPTVVITEVPGGVGTNVPTTSLVTITMYWQAPYESAEHQYSIVTQIR